MSPFGPVTQTSFPSIDAAPRVLLPLRRFVVVVVLMLPLLSIRATVDVVCVVAPTPTSYPPKTKYCPFSESESSPSEPAVPPMVSGLFDPLAVVGKLPTAAPLLLQPPELRREMWRFLSW